MAIHPGDAPATSVAGKRAGAEGIPPSRSGVVTGERPQTRRSRASSSADFPTRPTGPRATEAATGSRGPHGRALATVVDRARGWPRPDGAGPTCRSRCPAGRGPVPTRHAWAPGGSETPAWAGHRDAPPCGDVRAAPVPHGPAGAPVEGRGVAARPRNGRSAAARATRGCQATIGRCGPSETARTPQCSPGRASFCQSSRGSRRHRSDARGRGPARPRGARSRSPVGPSSVLRGNPRVPAWGAGSSDPCISGSEGVAPPASAS
jgi:hypothetical protein